ncbi:interferon-induced 35 kDa protein [Chanos chanos]|uniref:Interferon-induced 35 kDa protein n=1 Tax=Chanos chanos TaxID=29144 RepID=A0A6J2WR44_CHACN|nr:interferon-induced 35 kDa protein [Chanos chanos]
MSKMASDEDFSLVSEDEIEKIMQQVKSCEKEYEILMKDQKILADSRDSNRHFIQEFTVRSTDLRKSLEDEQRKQDEIVDKELGKQTDLREQQQKLMKEIMRMEEEVKRVEQKNYNLRQQTQVTTAVPEKKVVFNGVTAEGAKALSFDMKPRILFPMEGGTALITFEEEEVAQKVLSLKTHQVQLGDRSVFITVEARPVQFLMPCYVEMDTQVCPRRILVSSLPKKESEERLLDKLEIHFSKKKNGGGEVDCVDMLHDSGNVVIAFIDNNIAKDLTDKQDHEVEMEKGRRHKVKVTPFLNGDITELKTSESVCIRTVLLSGIPAITEPDNLQDLLEIHFQKTAHGGGEVDAIVYNPVGQDMLAVFEEDSPKES